MTTITSAARVSGTIKALYERACDLVHHDTECPARGRGDEHCTCDAVPFLNDLEALAAIQPDPEPQPVAWAVAVIARKEPQIGYRMRLSSAATEDEAIGESMRVFGELNPGWEIMQPAALPIHTTPSSAGMVSVEALLDVLHCCDSEAAEIANRIAGKRGQPCRHPDGVQVLEDAETIIRAALRALAGDKP